MSAPQSAASAPLARRLVLHAGMQKTGSTSIQHFLDTGVLKNARYFKGSRPNHSLWFMSMFGDNPEAHRTHRLRGRSREQVLQIREDQKAEIAAELDGSDIATYVFSGERISKSSRTEMERSQAFFSRWFPEIEVYAYIRSPAKFAASMFQQHLKFGNLPTIPNILPGYRARIENLEAAFGRDHVHLRAFDAASDRISDIVPDFLDWAGLEVGVEAQGPRNLSLSGEATALLYAVMRGLNRSLKTAEDVRFWNILVQRAQALGDQKYSFDADIFGQRRDQMLEDHAWVEQRLGQQFPDPLVPDAVPLRFASLEEVRQHGLKLFKARTGKRLGRLGGKDKPLQLGRVIGLLEQAGS